MENLYTDIYITEYKKGNPGSGLKKAVNKCANDILEEFVNSLPLSEYPIVVEAMKLVIKVLESHVPGEILAAMDELIGSADIAVVAIDGRVKE